MTNSSISNGPPPLPPYTLHPVPRLIPWISDLHLSLAAPIIVHWLLSGLFEILERGKYFHQYRIHTSAEELTRNRVSRLDCFVNVVRNQMMQTVLGLTLGALGNGDYAGSEEYDVAVWARRICSLRSLVFSMPALIGIDVKGIVAKYGVYETALASPTNDLDMKAASFLYWYLIPILQFGVALFCDETWHYFLHRFAHTNRWVYKNIHAIHHDLFVPYSYGGAYAHFLEYFFSDSMGVTIALGVSRLSIRQSIIFFSYVSYKAVMDHCGYIFPWDPIKWYSDNDAWFHDLHHQRWGLKYHFAIHFAVWDKVMGTYWVDREKAETLYEKGRDDATKLEEKKGI